MTQEEGLVRKAASTQQEKNPGEEKGDEQEPKYA